MNKQIVWIATPTLAVSLMLTGCGKSEQTQPASIEKAGESAAKTAGAAKPAAAEAQRSAESATQRAAATAKDAYGKLLDAFKSSDAATQGSVQSAVNAANAGKYADALKELQAVATKAKLTPEQQQLLKDTIAQLQKQIASSQMQGAVENATKSLPIGK